MTISDILFSNVTSGEMITRLALAMRSWQHSILSESVLSASDSAKRDFVNKWLNDFEETFNTGVAKVNILDSFRGVQVSSGALGAEVTISRFLDNYKAQFALYAETDFMQARMLRNNLAGRMKDYKTFFKNYDEFLDSSQAMGLSANERVSQFMLRGGKEFTGLRPIKEIKNGKVILSNKGLWRPDRYASMYSATRGNEAYNNFMAKSYVDSGGDIVQVSNHGTTTPICKQFEGKFFSLRGETRGIPLLTVAPPFHPNCKHILQARPFAQESQMVTTNKIQTKEYLNAKQDYTESQIKTANKQETYIVENRSTLVKA